jgi:hypothetical protein
MKNIEEMTKQDSVSPHDVDSSVENGRREFLKKAGRFAIYTPPAVMLMMRPSQAGVLKSAVGRPDKKKYKKHHGKRSKKIAKKRFSIIKSWLSKFR